MNQQQPNKNQDSELKKGKPAWNNGKDAASSIKNTKEFNPKLNTEVNPGRYNEELSDSNEAPVTKPDSFKTDANSTREPIKNNDSQAV